MLERSLDDMTLPQFRVLSLIASSPERAGRIATLAGVSRPSLTGVLDGLVQRGWVRRVDVDGDRRGREPRDHRRRPGRARPGPSRDRRPPRRGARPPRRPTTAQPVLDGLAALGRAFERRREPGARREADA